MSAVQHVVMVGRDAPLWLAACVVQSAFGTLGVKVTAVELPSGLRPQDVYPTLPALEALHARLRIEESTLLRATRGAFSLGQNFGDASRAVPSFFHAYGAYGAPIDGKAFLPYWLLARNFGLQVALEEFSLTAAGAKQGRMLIPDAATEAYGRTDYAYHLPAIEYARLLKQLAVRRGVAAVETGGIGASMDAGEIAAVHLADGRQVDAQLFIDLTHDSRLIGAALGVPRESWRRYFPVDRTLVAAGTRFTAVPCYAEIRASTQGWLGLFPTQAGTQVVQAYSSAMCSDEEAAQVAAVVSGMHLSEMAVGSTDPGRRSVAWEGNCVAIGAAACTLDPIHSVELHAVQMGLVHLLSLFPAHADYTAERAEYNRVMHSGFERLRDFQSAYYATNRYASSSFWTGAGDSTISPELAHKIATFRARGEVPMLEQETFALESWQALLLGHGVMPESYDPMIDRTPPDLMKREFRRILGFIKDKVEEQTTHDCYLRSVCAAGE